MATSLLTNAGKAILTNRIIGGGTQPTYIGWGTGAGITNATDTSLFTESGTRVSGGGSVVTSYTTNDSYQVIATLTSSSTQTITNVGLLDASTAGNLFIKGDFTGIPLVATDAIQFTIKCTFV